MAQLQSVVFDGLDIDSISTPRAHILSALRQLDAANDDASFIVESLRASLLSDLRRSMVHRPEQESPGWFSIVKFWFLIISGSILAIYGGYDAVSPFLPLTFVPIWVGPIVIMLFILCSVASFYAFDLSQISENIGVSFPNARHLLDVLSEQAEDIRLMSQYIHHQRSQPTTERLDELEQLVVALQLQQQQLAQLQDRYHTQLEDGHVGVAKWVASIVTGILFFASGYFVGQDPAIAMCSLLGVSASAMATPVFLLCFVSGVAAFALYWYVERPGVDQFISHLFGLDKEKISALNRTERCELTGEMTSMTAQLDRLKQQLDAKINQPCVATQTSVQDVVSPPLFHRVMCDQSTQTDSDIRLSASL